MVLFAVVASAAAQNRPTSDVMTSSHGLHLDGSPMGAVEPYVPCADGGTACLADEPHSGVVLGATPGSEGVLTAVTVWALVPATVQVGTLDDASDGLRVRELSPPVTVQPGTNVIPVQMRAYANDKVFVTDARPLGYPAGDPAEGTYLAPPFAPGVVSPWYPDEGQPFALIRVETDADRDGIADGDDHCDTAPGGAPCTADLRLFGQTENATVLGGHRTIHTFQVGHPAGGPVDVATLRIAVTGGRVEAASTGCVADAAGTTAACGLTSRRAGRTGSPRWVRIVTPNDGAEVVSTATLEGPTFEGAPVPLLSPPAPAVVRTTAVGPRALRPDLRRFRLARGRLAAEAHCPSGEVLAACLLKIRVTTRGGITLGTLKRRADVDERVRISIRLTARARRMLRSRRRVPAVIRVTRSEIGSRSVTVRRKLTLRAG